MQSPGSESWFAEAVSAERISETKVAQTAEESMIVRNKVSCVGRISTELKSSNMPWRELHTGSTPVHLFGLSYMREVRCTAY